MAGRLERAGADGRGGKKRGRLMERDRALEEIVGKKRAGEEGGEMLNRCGGGGEGLSGSQRGIDMVGTGESGDLHFI